MYGLLGGPEGMLAPSKIIALPPTPLPMPMQLGHTMSTPMGVDNIDVVFNTEVQPLVTHNAG